MAKKSTWTKRDLHRIRCSAKALFKTGRWESEAIMLASYKFESEFTGEALDEMCAVLKKESKNWNY